MASYSGFLGVFRANPLPSAPHPDRFIEPDVVGDGVTDDTEAIQTALETASDNNKIFRIPSGKRCRVTDLLFAWGGAHLRSEDSTGVIVFDVPSSEPRLVNFGISAKLVLAEPWTGQVKGLHMEVVNGVTPGAGAGRVLYMWRAIGNLIADNYLNTGPWPYSLTGSGNNANYVASGNDCIRQKITICRNLIVATQTNHGGEGIGVDSYDGALVTDNEVIGVGDDPLGIHRCNDFQLHRNTLTSVDGRIFIANCTRGVIGHNSHTRIAGSDGQFRQGIALVYLVF
jgi:hypothetical protein